ncbi:MAG: hypothetical protein ACUVWR_02440 [Anaerolineae bacterium]
MPSEPAGALVVVIDSDVFLLEFAFQRDARYEVNGRFLQAVRSASPAITIYNLMEILGQLSFNLAPERLARWPLWLQAAYDLTVLWPNVGALDAADFFREEVYERPLTHMQAQRLAFIDSLILGLAERAPEVEAFITWNAKHFRGKTPLTVLTPAEYWQIAT